MISSTEEIKSRLNIVDLVGDYVRLQKAGSNWKGLCPFHNEKSPSFSVNEERGFWHCFGCNKGGDHFAFLMDIEGLSFPEALKILAERTGVELQAGQFRSSHQTAKTVDALEAATKWFEENLWSPRGQKGLEYLRSRGISDETSRQFRLGYAPESWDGCVRHLLNQGFVREDIGQSGVVVSKKTSTPSAFQASTPSQGAENIRMYDRFRDRVIFPIADALGRVVGMSARVLPGADEKHAKYINTPETSVYHKSKTLYGIAQAKQRIKEKDAVIVVEGNMDVIALAQAGFENVVAVSGTALTADHLTIIKRYTKNIILFFDMDTAGQEAARKSAKMAYRMEMNVSLVQLTVAKDAAEAAQSDPEALKKAFKESQEAMRYFLQESLARHDKDNPHEKKKIAQELLMFIHAMHNPVERESWLHKVAQELSVSAGALEEILRTMKDDKITSAPATPPASGSATAPTLTRSDMIRDRVALLFLFYPEQWKSFCTDSAFSDQEKNILCKSTLVKAMYEYGDTAQWNFEKLRAILPEQLRIYAETVYYQKRLQEFGEEDPHTLASEEVTHRLQHYREELLKADTQERMQMLIRDMRQAEMRGDKDALQILQKECARLTHNDKK